MLLRVLRRATPLSTLSRTSLSSPFPHPSLAFPMAHRAFSTNQSFRNNNNSSNNNESNKKGGEQPRNKSEQRSGEDGSTNGKKPTMEGVHKVRNKSLALYLFAAVSAMIALSYASVPLYRLFCQVTGLGGTTQRIDVTKRKDIDKSKEYTVTFKGQSAHSIPWTFEPVHPSVDVFAGETCLAFYKATNNSDEAIIGIATYMVSPPAAGKFFTKIECFCFDEQRIGPHETVNMPVLFTLDPDINQAPSMKGVYNITLSYTFFRSSDQNIYFDEATNEYKTTSELPPPGTQLSPLPKPHART